MLGLIGERILAAAEAMGEEYCRRRGLIGQEDRGIEPDGGRIA